MKERYNHLLGTSFTFEPIAIEMRFILDARTKSLGEAVVMYSRPLLLEDLPFALSII